MMAAITHMIERKLIANIDFSKENFEKITKD